MNVLLCSMLLRWWQGMYFFLFQTENFGAAFLLFPEFSNSVLVLFRVSIITNGRKLQCSTLPSLNSWSHNTVLSVTRHFPIPSLSLTFHSNFWAVGCSMLFCRCTSSCQGNKRYCWSLQTERSKADMVAVVHYRNHAVIWRHLFPLKYFLCSLCSLPEHIKHMHRSHQYKQHGALNAHWQKRLKTWIRCTS